MANGFGLTIKLENNSQDALVIMEQNGVKTQKTISIEDLASRLASTHKLSTGILPKGTRYYSGSALNYIIGIEVASRKRMFMADFYNRRELAEAKGLKYKPNNIEVCFPPTLFIFNVKNLKLSDTKVFALKQTLVKEDDMLYRFPFGNTYADGRICWGNNKIPSIKNPFCLIEVMSLFLDSPFNGDLVDGITLKSFKFGDKQINDYWAFVKYLPDMEKFPEEALCYTNSKFNATVKEMGKE